MSLHYAVSQHQLLNTAMRSTTIIEYNKSHKFNVAEEWGDLLVVTSFVYAPQAVDTSQILVTEDRGPIIETR